MVTSRVKQALARARGLAGEVTGSLVQDGVTTSWTSGRVVSEGREARPGRTDVRTRVLEVQASGLELAPRAKAHVTFTGDTATWAVLAAEPVAPGGTVVAWRLNIVDRVDR
jgi:hypothetical protein